MKQRTGCTGKRRCCGGVWGFDAKDAFDEVYLRERRGTMRVRITGAIDEDEYSGFLVCPDCFGENGLKRRIIDIRPKFDSGNCKHHRSKKGVPIEEVSEIIKPVIQNNYFHTGYDYEGEPLGNQLLELIYELTSTEYEDVAVFIQKYLVDNDDAWPGDGDDPFFQTDVGYRGIGDTYDEQRSSKWEYFQSIIVNEQRFFNLDAKEALNEIFDGLQRMRDSSNVPAVRYLEPGENSIYRARVANDTGLQEQIAKDPAKELGAPPRKLRKAGRMNPSGIRAFYGSFDIDTCLAEIRPAVGERVMAVRFDLLRPILILDTTVFERPPKELNIFNRSYNERLSLWGFMREFMAVISRPTLPSDEHLDYITTQVVAEYLVRERTYRIDGGEKSVDGIVFNSAQHSGGKNIVLFGSAADVEGVEEDLDDFLWSFSDDDPSPALAVDATALTTRRVRSVRIETSEYLQSFVDY